MKGRRGFSLIEVMIALVAGGTVAALAAVATARVQLAGRARGERSGVAGSLRTTAGVITEEAHSLGSDSIAGTDLQLISASSLSYRAHRGLVVACRIGVDTLVLALDRVAAFRGRVPASGRDSLLLYVQGDSTGSIDAWLPLPLLTGPFPTACPSGGRGSGYTTQLTAATMARYQIPGSGVGRVFEAVNARLYASAAGPQFGLEEVSAGAVIQPIAGPLVATTGFELTAWDRAGLSTASAIRVHRLDLALRAVSARALAVGPGVVAPAADSALTAVVLRNAR
jgi:prepilin-type N-terminal cleavage/methylation domain-containing protein